VSIEPPLFGPGLREILPALLLGELVVVWGRAKDVQREIVVKREHPEEALITPEFHREIGQLVREAVETQP
jgi:hypothetical protein